ncbi:MAG: 5'-nucleotidase C-terminal domain-containing protein [Spirochaetaceae bacterium]|jgi:5'-nucleotidase/UDP-sugar diphosphatase|nr:5'-nucleotidase C-terminal domain-containing protein [Spirochaetaceae bacterium]
MKKFLLTALAVLFAASLYANPVQEPANLKDVDIVILHTNDHHGTVLPSNGQGGLAELAAYVKAVKATNKNVLLLDAGDINTGQAISNMFSAEPDILAYNIMGYDAATFGNHEFDSSLDVLKEQMDLAKFPFLSANIQTADGQFLGGHEYIVKEFEGIRVGIFGLTTLRTKEIASPDKSLVFLDERDSAAKAVAHLKMRENVDFIIALTHMGDVKETPEHVTSLDLAKDVDGINLIIDGHSHSFFKSPKLVNNTYIVSANEWGKYVGQVNVKVRGNTVEEAYWSPIPIGPDPEVEKMLAPYVELANASLKEVVGVAADDFIFGNRLTRYQETALGNAICDSNVYYAQFYNQPIDFAFHNGGNIRAPITQGPVTREQVLTCLPFENVLYLASLKGSDLLDLFNFIATIPQGAGAFPQFSYNVRYTIDKTQGDGVIKDLTINGQPVDPNKIYRFCTNDYILGGGDDYGVMAKATDRFNTSLLLSTVVIDALQYYNNYYGPIEPYLDGRLTVIGGVTP